MDYFIEYLYLISLQNDKTIQKYRNIEIQKYRNIEIQLFLYFNKYILNNKAQFSIPINDYMGNAISQGYTKKQL